MNDNNSLSHSKWNCKYHIVFAPKYRRQVIYGKIKADIGRILRTLCEQKKSEYNRGRSVPRPYSYACGNTSKFKRVTVYGISEREEFTDDI